MCSKSYTQLLLLYAICYALRDQNRIIEANTCENTTTTMVHSLYAERRCIVVYDAASIAAHSKSSACTFLTVLLKYHRKRVFVLNRYRPRISYETMRILMVHLYTAPTLNVKCTIRSQRMNSGAYFLRRY